MFLFRLTSLYEKGYIQKVTLSEDFSVNEIKAAVVAAFPQISLAKYG